MADPTTTAPERAARAASSLRTSSGTCRMVIVVAMPLK